MNEWSGILEGEINPLSNHTETQQDRLVVDDNAFCQLLVAITHSHADIIYVRVMVK